VIIMAGGEGRRLKPITNILPKALIPLGEKTILEHILQRFYLVGCNEFYISLNYKADMVKYYLSAEQFSIFNITYFQEEKPLGTAGSLTLIKDKIKSPFFLSNCDILIDQELGAIYDFHVENRNKITLVAAMKHLRIPYGTLQTKEDGLLYELTEKPEYNFKINSGLYILEPDVISEIPENQFFHITDLIEKLMEKKERVGVFPVSEGSWIDIGNWDDYLKNINVK
jgi:NDP-sugar pyrophosphorylase family protein